MKLYRTSVALAALALLAAAVPALAEDHRMLVQMPEPAREALRAEMLDFMSAVNQVIADLGQGKTAEAATVADEKLGLQAMGRHRNNPVEAMPGRYMPPEMHAMGRGLHLAAIDFAKVARGGDVQKALAAFQPVTASCVSCHLTYRVR